MTPRSPKPQPKTSTISRKLRNRADQNISVQPPQVPQLRNQRSRRAATLPSTRHISVSYLAQDSPAQDWDPAKDFDPFARSNTSHPTGLERNPADDLLLSHALQLSPFHSPRPSPSADFVSRATPSEPSHYDIGQTSGSELLPSPLPSLSGSQTTADYDLPLTANPQHTETSSLEYHDMSTLGFMMPAQSGYLDHHYPSSALSSAYPPMSQQHSEPRTSTAGGYHASYSASPSHGRESSEHRVLPPYQPPVVPRSSYEPPLGPIRGSPTPMAYPPSSSEPSPMLSSAPHSYSYPAIHPGQGINTLGSNTSSYPPPALYPSASGYDMAYSPLPTPMYPNSTTAASYASYDSSVALGAPASSVPGLSTSPSAQNGFPSARVIEKRQKPQCWEHGCNGRAFSTFSNLLRHQREKSGTAAKSYCPRCGAEFTRTTARNGHMAHDKCKPRRTSDTSR